jgi:hypothetical protein
MPSQIEIWEGADGKNGGDKDRKDSKDSKGRLNHRWDGFLVFGNAIFLSATYVKYALPNRNLVRNPEKKWLQADSEQFYIIANIYRVKRIACKHLQDCCFGNWVTIITKT